MKKRVAILGAGISGLSLGWYLKKKFQDDITLTILEKSGRPGGWISTHRQDSYLFERGPRSCRSKGSGAASLSLIKELGLADQVITGSSDAHVRYLYYQQKLMPLPSNLWQALFSPLMRGVWAALLCEPFVSKACVQDETIGDFFRRRFNQAVATRFIDPMTTGIYAGDIEKLSIRSCYPKLWQWEQESGSLIRALLTSKRELPSDPFIREIQKHPLFSLREGLETLPKTIAQKLEGQILYHAEVKKLQRHGAGFLIQTTSGDLDADVVISTLPAYAVGAVISNPRMLMLLNKVKATSVVAINVGYKGRVLPKSGFGYLIPSKEKESILGVVFDSCIFPEQNHHPDETRMTVMMGGAHHPHLFELEESSLVGLALDGLRKHLGIVARPDTLSILKAQNAIPEYPVGFFDDCRELETESKAYHPHFHILGSSFCGAAINDCIQNASNFVNNIKF